MAITPVFDKSFILDFNYDDTHFRGNNKEEKKIFNLQKSRKYEWEGVNATFLDMRIIFGRKESDDGGSNFKWEISAKVGRGVCWSWECPKNLKVGIFKLGQEILYFTKNGEGSNLKWEISCKAPVLANKSAWGKSKDWVDIMILGWHLGKAYFLLSMYWPHIWESWRLLDTCTYYLQNWFFQCYLQKNLALWSKQ